MKFGAVILIGKDNPCQTGYNGIQNTSQIRMLSRFSILCSLEHRNLSTYIELIRCHTGIVRLILLIFIYVCNHIFSTQFYK